MKEYDETDHVGSARLKGIGIVRIVFGLLYAIDASFKWQPDFINKFSDYLTGALDGQSPPVQAWLGFWINIVKVNPQIFGHVTAIIETIVALALMFGVFSNLADLGGALFSVVIWSTAEGFGGPYVAGSADVGTAIVYVFVFVMLFLSRSGMHFGFDRKLTPLLGRWGVLASGPLPKTNRS